MKMMHFLLAFTLVGTATADSAIKPNSSEARVSSSGNIKTDTCSRPEYPAEELRQGHQGVVTLLFLIDVNGTVKESKIHTSSGYPALDTAALDAISRCRFNPPVINNQPVEGWTTIQYVWKQQ